MPHATCTVQEYRMQHYNGAIQHTKCSIQHLFSFVRLGAFSSYADARDCGQSTAEALRNVPCLRAIGTLRCVPGSCSRCSPVRRASSGSSAPPPSGAIDARAAADRPPAAMSHGTLLTAFLYCCPLVVCGGSSTKAHGGCGSSARGCVAP